MNQSQHLVMISRLISYRCIENSRICRICICVLYYDIYALQLRRLDFVLYS